MAAPMEIRFDQPTVDRSLPSPNCLTALTSRRGFRAQVDRPRDVASARLADARGADYSGETYAYKCRQMHSPQTHCRMDGVGKRTGDPRACWYVDV
jgi:hypothetical protein